MLPRKGQAQQSDGTNMGTGKSGERSGSFNVPKSDYIYLNLGLITAVNVREENISAVTALDVEP